MGLQSEAVCDWRKAWNTVFQTPNIRGGRNESMHKSGRHGVTGVAEKVFNSELVSSVRSDGLCRSVDRAWSTLIFAK